MPIYNQDPIGDPETDDRKRFERGEIALTGCAIPRGREKSVMRPIKKDLRFPQVFKGY